MITRNHGLMIGCAALVVAISGACSKDTPTKPTVNPATPGPRMTLFTFTSDPASRVGRGESPTLTVDNARFSVGTDTRFIGVNVYTPIEVGDWTWKFLIEAPPGQRPTPGTYPVRKRGTTSGYGFEFAGKGNECGTGSGTITIEELETPGFIDKFRMTFSVVCDGTPAVNGRIVLNWVAGAGYR